MSAHTPGPWVVHSRAGQHEDGFAPIYADGKQVACAESTVPDAQVDANARLISAAPDLLAALQELAIHHKATCKDPRCDASLRAWVVIAKAKGGL